MYVDYMMSFICNPMADGNLNKWSINFAVSINLNFNLSKFYFSAPIFNCGGQLHYDMCLIKIYTCYTTNSVNQILKYV